MAAFEEESGPFSSWPDSRQAWGPRAALQTRDLQQGGGGMCELKSRDAFPATRRVHASARFLDHVECHDRVLVTRRIDIARHRRTVHSLDAATAFVWE